MKSITCMFLVVANMGSFIESKCLFIFLEYRAELYWRLESKRMKVLSKENQPINAMPADQNNNINKSGHEISENEVRSKLVHEHPKN